MQHQDKNVTTDLPTVTFAIPVLNEEAKIARCLESIRSLDYPQQKVEIIIADAGCIDRTIEIAQKYDCTIIDNPRKLAEPGLYLGHQLGKGEVKVFFAADNACPTPAWLKLMVAPFMSDESIMGAYTQIIPPPAESGDNAFNRYYSLLHVEPFSWFVYGDGVHPARFHRRYSLKERHDDYDVFRFAVDDHPLIAFAQGFCINAKFKRKEEYLWDDILPFLQMIEEGRKVAYVPDAGVYHFHLNGFRHYLKKYQWRIRNSLHKKKYGFDTRLQYLTLGKRLRKYLWLLYGTTVLGPLWHSLRWSVRDSDPVWFWHIPASVGLSWLIVYEVLRRYLYSPLAKDSGHE